MTAPEARAAHFDALALTDGGVGAVSTGDRFDSTTRGAWQYPFTDRPRPDRGHAPR
ncbi:hypothetical protein AB0O67_18605 [Streptomyces sp. NPDC086077]|uniref:hypothetical protein n=1 Tax=Streptomyces sp. NPDC086077 TaxID=3154862 RepID=UPI003416569D